MAVVQVRGLKEVQKALKAIDKDLPKGLRTEFLVVARAVVGTAQGNAPRVSGRAAGSIRPRAAQTGAGIAFGGNAAPYFPWLDFGGTTGKGHRPGAAYSGSVKRPWMGRPGDGRYVYPSIAEMTPEIEQAANDAVINLAKAAGFEVK